ncbi:MAG: hypothetical protein HY841_03095 [Bacteroidetes bacterium]|nr:hypothetical protein [Bacteroidota bacterium]
MNEPLNKREELFETIARSFEYLIPRDVETIFLLLNLQAKIENKEIDDIFSQKDFEDSVDEVTVMLKRERGIQKENISKRLSQHFYTTLKLGEEYRYELTVFAKDFTKLLLNEVSPNYENLELVHTFKRTLPVQDDDVTSIDKLNYWFAHHYSSSKKFIHAHTDNLQRFVDKKVSELRVLLKPNVDNPKEMITQFLIIFEQLGKQTEGITSALNFKQNIIDKLKNSEPNFKDKREDWEQYDRIYNEVISFFENIDNRVLSINDKIQQARTRLKSLYDNLRYKQQYKLRIEKFLLLLLKGSKTVDIPNKQDKKIVLPTSVVKKEIVYHRDRFYFPPIIDFAEYHKMESPFYQEDEEFKRLSEEDKIKQLARQENTIKWMDNIRGEIELGREVIFEQWMDKIVSKEDNLEVPIDVCFGIIDEYKNRDDVQLEIDKTLIMPLSSNVALWKLKIKPNQTESIE